MVASRPEPGGRSGGRPRLLLLTPDYPPSPGGIQVVSHRLAAALAGFETTVLAPASAGAAEFDAHSGVRTLRVASPGALPGPARIGLLNAAALARASMLRPQLTLSMHIVMSPAAAAIARATGARAVQYFHAEEIGARPRLAAFAASNATASIVVSEYTAGLVREASARHGKQPGTLHVIGNGTDVPEDHAPFSDEPGRATILTVGRIEERYKGHDAMLRALPLVLAKVPEAQWVVVGDGSLRPSLEALAKGLGVDHAVRFLGAVSDEERNLWLRRARLVAMPSRLPAGGFAGEGFGIVYLEAGAYGKPVVAGNVGGALDAVSDGETGLLVDPTDPLALAEAIVRLLRDSELAGRLGANGRANALAHTWPHVAERVEAVLLGALDRSKTG
ncbi:MAG TPA: glycosyltransferase family 4 protein [Solirubrobacteraceae bacterium]|nr:glycosyltransferase family 4 protein [Solirubrobacteraceae bacterium]